MGNAHPFFRSSIPRSSSKTAQGSKRWGGWGNGGWGHGGWGGHGHGHGFAAPYGHPITHPGFSTIGFPGHALATADVKNTIAHKRGRSKRQLLPAQYMAPAGVAGFAAAPVSPFVGLHPPMYAAPFMHAPMALPAYPAAVPAAVPFAPQGRKF